jgi:hypothetical protein
MEPLTGEDPAEVAGYRLRARLGSGGMGRVYLAFTAAGRPVALKVVRPELGDDGDFRDRFRQEVEVARRVHGLYTAQVLDADPAAVPPWLVTAYVPGPSLQQAVAEHGPMPEQTVLVLMAGVAEALAAIHAAGVVHRDLKPSNVLLAPDGPRVIDFGIARAADATTLTRSGVRVGSPHFMAPEQVSGLPVSPALDVFALGSLAAFAVLGRPPFGDGNEVAVLYRVLHQEADLSGCPQRLREVIERCLAKDAAARPSPADIISLCRAQTAGQTGQIAQPWLPPAVAVALAAHVPPPATFGFPPTVTVSPSPAPGMAPAPAPGAMPAVPLAPTAPGTEVIPHAFASGATAPPPRHRLLTPVIVGSGLAALGVAALIVAAVLVLGNHGGNIPLAKQSLAAAPGQSTTLRQQAAPPPSASPSPTTALDSCLVGNWKASAVDLLNTINGAPVQFTGGGTRLTVRPDGSAVSDWPGVVLTATVNGDSWTDVLRGTATMHLETYGGSMLVSGVTPSKNAEWTLYDNGVYNNSGPLTVEPGPTRYTCAGNSLREFPDNGSLELARQLTKPTHVTGS